MQFITLCKIGDIVTEARPDPGLDPSAAALGDCYDNTSWRHRSRLHRRHDNWPDLIHDWIGTDWAFFFSHPADFTPVCTTEMGRTAQRAGDFAARGVKPIGLSTDTTQEHLKWIEDVNETQNTTLQFPIVADPECKVAMLYEMIHPGESSTAAVRTVFIIDPDKKLRLSMTLPDERRPQFR